MTDETPLYDVADYLTSEDRITAYLEEAFLEGDTQVIAAALGNIARAKGMTKLAGDSGITRAALYQTLSRAGNPRLSTLLGVTKALGLRLAIMPRDAA